MPFALIRAMAEESQRRADRIRNGGFDWEPDLIPEPPDPDGPPPKALFTAYAQVVGKWSRKRAEAEYDRQVKRGGHEDPELKRYAGNTG